MPAGQKKLSQAAERDHPRVDRPGSQDRPARAEEPGGLRITDEERAYWAFQPVRKPAIPAVECGTPDRCVHPREADREGAEAEPDADKRTLIRRVDVRPDRPAADAGGGRRVRRTTTSPTPTSGWSTGCSARPHYGERWGRHWLDVAGYADSDGYGTGDTPRPHAWQVPRLRHPVRSTPTSRFDRFVIEQLAGDELVPTRRATDLTPGRRRTAHRHRLPPHGPRRHRHGGRRRSKRNNVVADTVKIVGARCSGLTVGCAQCHDHRYDPIPQADYYRLRAVFEPAFDLNKWQTPASRLMYLTPPDAVKQAR